MFCLLWRISIYSFHKKLQNSVLKDLHKDDMGTSRMKSINKLLWWTGLDKQIEDLAKSCLPCQAVQKTPAVAPFHPWIWPTKPWQRIHIHFAGPFMGKSFPSKWSMLIPNNQKYAKWQARHQTLLQCYVICLQAMDSQNKSHPTMAPSSPLRNSSSSKKETLSSTFAVRLTILLQ